MHLGSCGAEPGPTTAPVLGQNSVPEDNPSCSQMLPFVARNASP